MAQNNFFINIAERNITGDVGKRVIVPQKYRTLKLDVEGIKSFLWSLPTEKTMLLSRNSSPVLELPMPDGTTARFHVWQSSIQAPGLEAKFPDIKTFAGQGIDDPYATIRFDYTDFGFHAQIISAATGNIYIDTLGRGNVNNYMSYYNADNIKATNWKCETLPSAIANFNDQPITNVVPVGACRGTQLYTYRLAIACTGEYAIAVGGTTASLLHSAIVTTVNRVDGVYENEFTIRLVLIANNNLIEFMNPSTDPFTGNNNANTLINQSQQVIDANIGDANYDVGHTFSTGGGGLSGLGVNCKSGQKAQSITGSPSPTGDGYDIDYVAHEMGHAFGCDHTFNSNASNCGGGNRNAATAYEVGSGTTIMAYAGICDNSSSTGGDNTQNHSDPYFHSVSFDEASVYANGAGGNCPVKTNTGNTLPVITSMGVSGLTIPVSTPFVLTGTATDADGDALTYDWEEWDLGPTTTWNGGNANTTSPLFKSQIPKTSGTRSFPSLPYILAGFPTNPPGIVGGLKGETMPTTARAMKFRLTVRDNRAGGGSIVTGGSGCSTFNTPFIVNVAGTTPFAVTSPNGGESYSGGSSQTITWNNASTDVAPFNVANVKISYSTDGGLTYPVVLSASTPNDGSEALIIPAGLTTTARIKIEAVGNIFYDISNANFSVTAPVNDYAFGTTTPLTVSCPAPSNPAITISTSVTGTFVTPIILTATAGVPAGTTVSFSPATITPGNSTVATLNNAGSLANGTYNITVTGTAGTTVHTTVITFIVSPGAAPTISTQPAPTAVCAPATATFTVAAVGTGLSYQWQVSTSSAPTTFTNVSSGTGGSTDTYNTDNTTAAMNGNSYRVIVTGSCNTVTSNAVILTVNTAPAITADPQPVIICSGTDAVFNVTTTGTNLTYVWQSATSLAGTYTPVVGAPSSSTLTLPAVTSALNGNYYRVVVSGTCSPVVTSIPVLLTVNTPVAITTNTANAGICYTAAGPNTSSFSVAATGTAATYQWQESTDGQNYSNVSNSSVYSGANTNSLNLTGIALNMNGYKYRVFVSGTCTPSGILSNAATLTVSNPVVINANPADTINCEGNTTSFTVNASGTILSYQWSYSADGVSFIPVPNAAPFSGTALPTLTISNLTTLYNNYRFKVVVTGTPCGISTSTAAKLTVNINPSPVLTLAPYNSITPSTPTVLLTTVNPAGNYVYTYTRDGAATNLSGASVPVNVDLTGTFQVTATNTLTGCFAKSNTVTVTDSASSILFVYPNPSSGVFQVRYYNQGSPAPSTARTLSIYDAKGSRVYSKKYPINARYDRMDVNLTNAQHGVYLIDLRDANGKRLASGRVTIQ